MVPAQPRWAMQAAYDTLPADVIACIGPSIGPESYEVGEDVLLLAYAKLADEYQLFTYPNGADQRPYFNLWRANASQLIESGVPEAQIKMKWDRHHTEHCRFLLKPPRRTGSLRPI